MQVASHLPKVFDVVLGIFGTKGACVRPKADVVTAVQEKCTQRGGLTLAEAQRQVNLCSPSLILLLHILSLSSNHRHS